MFASLLFASSASAQAVRVDLDPCVGIDEVTVRRIVLLELQTAERSADPDSDTTTVMASCSDLGTRIEVNDPITGKQSIRHLRLSTVDRRARARMLALSISELVSASWLELRVPTRAVPPIERTASDEAQAVVRERRPTLRTRPPFWIDTFGLAHFGEMPVMGGLQLGLQHQAHPNIGWRLDVVWLRRALQVDLGQVRATTLRADIALLAGNAWGAFRLDAQVGVQLGSMLLEGITENAGVVASSVRAASVAPYLGMRLALQAASRFRISLLAQAGVHALGIEGQADGASAFEISGFWLSAGLGFGVRL